jgi:capsular polysaccharide biosynthesis protein
VRVWVQGLSDLVLTALKERGTTAARRYASYLSVEPRIAARAAARAMVAVVLVAVAVTGASLWQPPTYEASAQVRVDWQQEGQWKTLEFREPPPTLMMIHAIDRRPVAKEAIQRLELEMSPVELLDKLTVEQVENTTFIALRYEDTNAPRAQQIVNTVGEVFSEYISERSAAGSNITATVFEKAAIPYTPVSPHPLRNGLLTLVVGLALCAMLALALPRPLAAKVAGNAFLGGRIRLVRQGVGQAGISGGRHGGSSEAERIKEELLEALVGCGKLTGVEAALESSLTVTVRPSGCYRGWRPRATSRSQSSTASYCTLSGGSVALPKDLFTQARRETVRKASSASQTPEHQAAHRHVDEGFCALR